MEAFFTHAEMEADRCPDALRRFVKIWVEWETAGGKKGRTAGHLNNRQGRRNVSSDYDCVCLEAHTSKTELVGVWINGARLKPPGNKKEAAAGERFLLEHAIPDPDPAFEEARAKAREEEQREQAALDSKVIDPDDDLMREVVKRDLQIGPRGGEHWSLVLSCGHTFNYSHRRYAHTKERCDKCRTIGSVRMFAYEVEKNRNLPGVVPRQDGSTTKTVVKARR